MCSFVVSLFLVDNTVQIFERTAPNSKMLGGRLLERMLLKRPGGVEHCEPRGFFVGAEIHAAGRSVAQARTARKITHFAMQ